MGSRQWRALERIGEDAWEEALEMDSAEAETSYTSEGWEGGRCA